MTHKVNSHLLILTLMKKVAVFILLVGLLVGSTMRAQLPNVPYVNYSTKTGVFTDTRDGKMYAYKKYGDYEWFMQNLNWDGYDGVNESTRGSAGVCSLQDPNGEKYGRFYNTSTSGSKLCPEGWELSTQSNWLELANTIAGEYGVNIAPDGQYTITNALNYLRGGGLKSQYPDALWENDRGTLDEKAEQIQFNLLPAGGFNGSSYISGEEIGKKAYFLIGGNDRFQNNTSDSRYDRNALRHIRASNTYGSVRCVRFDGYPDVTITTPYPETIEIKQINSAEKERKRLAQAQKKYDHQPTGFYVEKGKRIIVNVEILTPSADNASPAIVVGTAGQENNTPKEISLRAGLNTIEANQHEGGLIYLRYVTDAENNPQGKACITFTSESEHVRAPQYIYNVTTDEEFASMLGKYRTPEVLFYSDYAIMVARHTHAIQYSMNEDKQLWMEGVHLILEKEDEISGLDNNHSNALHHRMHAGEVRYLFVQNLSSSPHASSGGYTAYPAGLVNRYLTYNGTYNACWMLGHEVGHQHQQPAYMINQSTESTVNLYAYHTERFIQFQKGNPNYNRTSAERWQAAQTTYLQLPVEERVYNMPDSELRALTGMDQNELRFMPWEQLFIIFGDDFYKMLHRITREENVLGGYEQERRVYLIWKSSQISGYDLRDFFNQWGIRPTESYYVNQVNTNIERCLADGSIIPMPYDNLHLTVTGQNRPSWAPLTLRGITTSSPSLDLQPEDRLASKNKYADYSTRKGVFTDTRDGKHYPYKTYGNKDWFMINLDWDGYNGTNEQTKGTVGVYAPNDPTGEVYGRMYPTNAGSAANNWCPPGWKYANESDFANLIDAVKNEYNLSSTEEVITGLKGGGDRDYFTDGLWRKGGGNIDVEKSSEIGFNILPAGVFNKDAGIYEYDDEEGLKASFVTNGWNHNIFTATSDTRTKTNRNSRHHASVRCVRNASPELRSNVASTGINEDVSDISFKIYPNPASSGQTIYIKANPVTSLLEEITITIYDIAGNILIHKSSKDSITSLKMPEVPGTYFVRIKSGLYHVSQAKVVVR